MLYTFSKMIDFKLRSLFSRVLKKSVKCKIFYCTTFKWLQNPEAGFSSSTFLMVLASKLLIPVTLLCIYNDGYGMKPSLNKRHRKLP